MKGVSGVDEAETEELTDLIAGYTSRAWCSEDGDQGEFYW